MLSRRRVLIYLWVRCTSCPKSGASWASLDSTSTLEARETLFTVSNELYFNVIALLHGFSATENTVQCLDKAVAEGIPIWCDVCTAKGKCLLSTKPGTTILFVMS